MVWLRIDDVTLDDITETLQQFLPEMTEVRTVETRAEDKHKKMTGRKGKLCFFGVRCFGAQMSRVLIFSQIA